MITRTCISIIRFYQKTLSPDHGPWAKKKTCMFYPTCSEYTIEVLHKYGFVKGIYRGARRVLRCHPWQKKHIDLPT